MAAPKQLPNPAAARRILQFLAVTDLGLAAFAAFLLPDIAGREIADIGLGITLYQLIALGFVVSAGVIFFYSQRFRAAAGSSAGPIQR